MKINGMECSFHHLGIPTAEPMTGERFSERFRMYTSDSPCATLRIQRHRFEPDSPLHSLIQRLPHAAFQVPNLEGAIAGYTLLLGPYEPIAGFRVAIVEDRGYPVELIQTDLSDDEVWSAANPDQALTPLA